jgi:hypothetical protein
MSGVEVEVRGAPVTVSEMIETRTLYINAEGLWIRITVPRRTTLSGLAGAGSGGIGSDAPEAGGNGFGAGESGARGGRGGSVR